MAYCTHCGSELPLEGSFCANCGAGVERRSSFPVVPVLIGSLVLLLVVAGIIAFRDRDTGSSVAATSSTSETTTSIATTTTAARRIPPDRMVSQQSSFYSSVFGTFHADVTDPQFATDSAGGSLLCVGAVVTNTGSTRARIDLIDFDVVTPTGSVSSGWPSPSGPPFGATLDPGGTTQGTVCFHAPSTGGSYKVEMRPHQASLQGQWSFTL